MNAPPSPPQSKTRQRPGFALIVTLSVTALLVVLIGGLLMFLNATLSSIGARRQAAQAEQTTQMAARIALGEMQRALGPDQRITVPSNLFDENNEAIRHLTTVFDSAEVDPTDRSDLPNPELSSGGERIRAVLASSSNGDGQRLDWETIGASAAQAKVLSGPGGDSEVLVGLSGVGGPDPQEEDIVRADRIEFDNLNGNDFSYSWFASDESQKATIVGPEVPQSLDDWELGMVSSNLGPARADLVDLLPEPLDSNNPRPLPTLASTELALGQDNWSAPWHEISVINQGVLADVRRGGLRHDLSVAFESDIPTWDEITEFHNSTETYPTDSDPYSEGLYQQSPLYYHENQAPPQGYLWVLDGTKHPESDGNGVLRGPTWDILRNHYRSYKREWEKLGFRGLDPSDDETFVARPSMPADYSWEHWAPFNRNEFAYWGSQTRRYIKDFGYDDYPIDFDSVRSAMIPATPVGSYLTGGSTDITDPPLDTTRPRAAAIQPVVTRVTFGFGAVRDGGEGSTNIRIAVDPYFTVWNPYDVPIEFATISMHFSHMRAFWVHVRFTDTNNRIQYARQAFGTRRTQFAAGSADMRLVPEGDSLRLEPGQLMVVSPTPVTNLSEIEFYDRVLIEATEEFQYGPSGHMITLGHKTVRPRRGSDLHITVTGDGSWDTHERVVEGSDSGLINSVTFQHFFPEDHSGSQRSRTELLNYNPSIDDNKSVKNISTDQVLAEPLLQLINFHSLRRSKGLLQLRSVVDEEAIRKYPSTPFYFGAVDLNLDDPGEGDSPAFAQSNVRGFVVDPRDTAVEDPIAPTWNYDFIELDGLLFSSTFNIVNAEGANPRGVFGDPTTGEQIDELTIFEVPRRPLLSLASLQSANTGEFNNQQNLAIGNSWPLSMARELDTIQPESYSLNGTEVSGGFWGQVLMDDSWASNEALWDRYFFSGANWGSVDGQEIGLAQEFRDQALDYLRGEGENPIASNRIQLRGSAAGSPDDLLLHDRIARHLALVGPFNVNSTSVDAWMATLAGNAGRSYGLVDSSGSVSEKSRSDGTTSFSRFQLLRDREARTLQASEVELDEAELRALAEAIVEQVRERGPFMGLADFVNRRLANDETGEVGALQAAIDESGINDDYMNESTRESLAQADVSTWAGTPSYLSQADVLTSVGPALTARGDTFTVRVQASAGPDGADQAKRWLEMVVARVPEWIEPSADPAIEESFLAEAKPLAWEETDGLIEPWEANSQLSGVNQTFGRRLRIVSMRWLSNDDL